MSDGGRAPRRILHTSDLHLESTGDVACHSLETVVDIANQTKADLVIIAGDLFDHNRVDDNLVSFTVEQLRRLQMNTVVLPGNHDYLAPSSVFEKADLWRSAPNIRIFKELEGETFSFPELGVAVWGKPFTFYQGFDSRPLEGAPQPERDGQWYVAVIHGYYVHHAPPASVSFHIPPKEVVTSGWDYIALGHLITFGCVCNEPVKAYYCGSPSVSGTVAVVDLAEDGVQVTRYSLWDKEGDMV